LELQGLEVAEMEANLDNRIREMAGRACVELHIHMGKTLTGLEAARDVYLHKYTL
jgi:hypothetical protein